MAKKKSRSKPRKSKPRKGKSKGKPKKPKGKLKFGVSTHKGLYGEYEREV